LFLFFKNIFVCSTPFHSFLEWPWQKKSPRAAVVDIGAIHFMNASRNDIAFGGFFLKFTKISFYPMTQVQSISSFLPSLPPPPSKLPPPSLESPGPELEENTLELQPPTRSKGNTRPTPPSSSLEYFHQKSLAQQDEFLPVHLASISTKKLNRELAPGKFSANVLKLVLVQNMLCEIHNAWARNSAARLSAEQEQDSDESMDTDKLSFPPNVRTSSLQIAVETDDMEVDQDCNRWDKMNLQIEGIIE
jgi:hypothetical protein